MATAAQDRGDLAAVGSCCRQILDKVPDDAAALNLLGVIECQLGNPAAGIVWIAKAAAAAPDNAGYLNNLGTGLSALDRDQDALLTYQRALQLDPAHATAHNNIATLYRNAGNLDQASHHFQHALGLRPDYVEAMSNYGNVLLDLGQLDKASEILEKAVALNPAYEFAINNLAIVRQRQGRYTEAEGLLRKAIELAPAFADPHTNLAEVLKETGRVADAVDCYQTAISLAPDQPGVQSNYVFALNNLASVTPQYLTRAHRDWNTNHAPRPVPERPQNTGQNHRRRIGYVSADFRQHSVSYFLEPILANHDRQQFEIFCYSNGPMQDQVSARLRASCDHWRPIYGLSDSQAYDLIRTDQIDILVDLSGHTMGNRLALFARRPAPMQVSYLGYPATTGLDAMDYRLTDVWADPVGRTEDFHTEKLIRIDGGFLCYQPPADAPEVAPCPRLENGYITFGSCNNLAKTTPAVIDVWAAILGGVPDSRLLLKGKALADEHVRARYLEAFAVRGIDGARLDLRSWISGTSHLAVYNHMDIALDPFPYNGTTTTCETLWMGVPTIAVAGDRHSARVALSLASMIGHPEMVAADLQSYKDQAIELAACPQRLDAYRRDLRPAMRASRLCDGAHFTRALEKTFLEIGQAAGTLIAGTQILKA